MIRLFQFVNITPKAEMNPNDYIALGTFDYMSTWSQNWSEKECQQIVSDPFGFAIRNNLTKNSGEHVYIVGFRDKNDERFWTENKHPFLFITSIKLLKHENLKILESKNIITYGTLDSSDGLVCLKTEKYSDGYERIMRYDYIIRKKSKDNRMSRGSTMVLVNPMGDNIKDEKLDILLRCRVSDRDKFEGFLSYVETRAQKKIIRYGSFGYDDYIVKIDNLSSKNWSTLYVGGESITDEKQLDRYGIIDIRTEVLERPFGRDKPSRTDN